MDLKATIDLIIKDINEASDIIDDLKKYPGVPSIQVELAKSKCKSAAEVISLLKELNDNSIIKEKIEEKVREDLPKEDKKEKTIGEIEQSCHIIAQPEEIPPALEKEEKSHFTLETVTESTIIADKFSHLSNRFNEQLGNLKTDENISEMLRIKSSASLLEAIGVNDKFLFIRGIFNGNKEMYDQAIKKIDDAENFSDAKAIITSYTGESHENEAVKQLLELVKRKLPKDE